MATNYERIAGTPKKLVNLLGYNMAFCYLRPLLDHAYRGFSCDKICRHYKACPNAHSKDTKRWAIEWLQEECDEQP